MKTDRDSKRLPAPNVQMGSGLAPPRVVKHVKVEAAAKKDEAPKPKVQMGSGYMPPRVLKHLKGRR